MEFTKEEYKKLKDKLFCISNTSKKKSVSKDSQQHSVLLDYIYNNQKFYNDYCKCVFNTISSKCLRCNIGKIRDFIKGNYG